MQEHFVYLRLSCRCHPLLRWKWQAEKCFQARQKHVWQLFSQIFGEPSLIVTHIWRNPYSVFLHLCGHDIFKEFPSQYIKDNLLMTTSRNFSDAALLCALLTLCADRILLSIDYPYQRIADGVHFIETAPISDADKTKICHKNAKQLLKW